MRTLALILFGSYARGTQNLSSDIDLLAITDGPRARKRTFGNTELQFVNTEDMSAMANRGDLFALHLAFEGVPIADEHGAFRSFKSKLRIRSDYEIEKQHSVDLASYLIMYGRNARTSGLVNKRLAWCIRTYCIAILAEQGRMIFSPEGISNAFPSEAIRSLITSRRSEHSDDVRFELVREFFEFFDLEPLIEDSEENYLSKFLLSSNHVGLATMKEMAEGEQSQSAYE